MYRVEREMTMQEESDATMMSRCELRIEICVKRRERLYTGTLKRRFHSVTARRDLKNCRSLSRGLETPNDSDGESNVTQFLRKRGREGKKGSQSSGPAFNPFRPCRSSTL